MKKISLRKKILNNEENKIRAWRPAKSRKF